LNAKWVVYDGFREPISSATSGDVGGKKLKWTQRNGKVRRQFRGRVVGKWDDASAKGGTVPDF